MKFRKKPVVIEATPWWVNGDHPMDHAVISEELLCAWPILSEYKENVEGAVVRRFRRPDMSGEDKCLQCGAGLHFHGWVDTLEGGHTVCPGDYIITGVKGEVYPCKPDIFNLTYDPLPD